MFDQKQMRTHLLQCLEASEMLPVSREEDETRDTNEGNSESKSVLCMPHAVLHHI